MREALFVIALVFAASFQALAYAQKAKSLDARVIYSDVTVKIDESGAITKDVNESIEILSEQGANLYRTLTIDYYSETESVKLNEAYTLKDGKNIFHRVMR